MPLEHTPIDLQQLSPAVAKIVGPDAPPPAKMMAAKGLVPVGPKDLATILYMLSLDADANISTAAKDKAGALPDNILGPVLGDALDGRVIDFFAERVASRPTLIEKILLNQATDDQTFVMLAGKLTADNALEILAGNQSRVMRCPAIIEAIYFNKAARMSTVERLMELAARNNLPVDQIPGFKDFAAQIMGAAASATAPAAEAAPVTVGAPKGNVAQDELFQQAMAEVDPAKTPEEDAALAAQLVADEEAGAEEPAKRALNISQLPLAAKIRLATIGNASHRSVLVRDSNRIVAMSAIKSPAVSEHEAVLYANNRSVPEEVVRYIASKKEWQRSYTLKVALVNNPKCPLSQAMHYLPHLRPSDLRGLARSKNIPAALVNSAKEMLRKRS